MNPNDAEIVQLDERYLSGLTTLLNDTENQELVGGSLEAKNEDQVLKWLHLKNTDHNTHIFAITYQSMFAGYVLITSIDRINGHALFGINISRSWQGKGLGAVAMNYVHRFCKDNLSLRKLVLYVRADNQRAISLYERLGYKPVGCLQKHINVNGSYFSNNIMEIFF